MTFKNANIYDGMKELVKKALTILDREGFECVDDFAIEVDTTNIPPISFLLNSKISNQIYPKMGEIEQTREFTYTCDLVNTIPKIPSNSRLGNSYEIELGLEHPLLEEEHALIKQKFRKDIVNFLSVHCNLRQNFEFDETIFNGLYNRFEERLCGKKYVMALCPLKKFYLEINELVLDDEIKIRKISRGELSIINEWMGGNILKKLDDIQFTIEYTYDENDFRNPEDVDEGPYSAHKKATAFCEKKFIEIVALLRLSKDGDFHNPLEFFQVPFWDNAGQSIYYNVCDRRIPEDRNYILKREETEDFKEFYKKSLRFRDDRRMFIALERFNLAYEKKRFEDNIIDYAIALEALFGTKNKNRVRMRNGLKSGFLVGDSVDEITKIHKFMRDVYDLRSTIVHGDEITFPMKIGEEVYYLDHQLKSDIIKLFRRIIKCFFDEERRRYRGEIFAIIEEELKSEEKPIPKNKSGEELIKSILDKFERKRKLWGQPEHELTGFLK